MTVRANQSSRGLAKTAAAPGADSQLPLGPRDCNRDVLMLVATVLLTVG